MKLHTYLLIGITMSCALNMHAAVIGRYSFEEINNGVTPESSSYRRDSTQIGSNAITLAPGVVGSAAQFSVDTYFDVGDVSPYKAYFSEFSVGPLGAR